MQTPNHNHTPPPTMPPATSVVTTASSMSSSDDISLPPSPSPSPPHDPYEFASSDEISSAPPAKKKRPYRRLGTEVRPGTWPAADELVLLEAMTAHKEQHGRLTSRPEITAAVAGSLPHVSAEQISTRVSLLRQRYDASVRRLRRGTVPVTDDDVRIFRLSKRIWEGEPKRSRPRAEPHHERRSFEELERMYPCLAAEVEAIDARSGQPGMMRHAFGMMGDEQAAVLEAKVRNQRVEQMKADVRRGELRSAVYQAFISAMEE